MPTLDHGILITCIIALSAIIYVMILFVLEHLHVISFDLLDTHLKYFGYVAVAGVILGVSALLAYMIWSLLHYV